MSQDLVIKTTARLQEASEPNRHKPIIRIEDRDGRTTLSHIGDANELANTIRATIDSGRDNPFRPDGEIYRMTDPIVDFYKFGSNRSGTQTPTYANLAQPSCDAKLKSDKKSKTSPFWKRREPPTLAKQNQKKDTGHNQLQTEPKKRSRWRRWFCCCCYYLCNANNSRTTTQTNGNGRLNENIDHYNIATAARGAKSQDLIISNSNSLDKSTRKLEDNNSTNWDSNSPAAIKSEAPQLDRFMKQTKVVIVDELPNEAAHNIAESISNEFSTYNDNNNNNNKPANGTSRRVDEAKTKGKSTEPKWTTSKCVVS